MLREQPLGSENRRLWSTRFPTREYSGTGNSYHAALRFCAEAANKETYTAMKLN